MADEPRKVTVHKTAVFKIHNPSQRRRALLMDCLRRADSAYWRALRKIEPRVKALIGLERKEKVEALRQLQRELSAWLYKLPLSNAQHGGLLYDILAQASSYVELAEEGFSPNWPIKDRTQDSYAHGLSLLCDSTTVEEYNEARDMMARRPADAPPRPVNIVRNDRLFESGLILADTNGRLFAWIATHPAKSRHAKKVSVDGLVNTRTGEVMKASSKVGELFPLECSDWHIEEFIHKGRMQSSRLFHRDGEFFFSCTFQYVTEAVEPKTILGVDRGIENLAAWAVIDGAGSLLLTGRATGAELRDYQRTAEQRMQRDQRFGRSNVRRWRGYGDQIVHRLANDIVALAEEYKAQVVLEDLKTITMGPHQKRPKGQKRSNYRRLLTRAQYQKLTHILEYKLQLRGLPKPRTVHPAYTSVSCPECGHKDKANRPDQASFICQGCGFSRNADENAAVNVALKWLWLRAFKPSWKGKDGKLKDKHSFNVWLATRGNGGRVVNAT